MDVVKESIVRPSRMQYSSFEQPSRVLLSWIGTLVAQNGFRHTDPSAQKTEPSLGGLRARLWGSVQGSEHAEQGPGCTEKALDAQKALTTQNPSATVGP